MWLHPRCYNVESDTDMISFIGTYHHNCRNVIVPICKSSQHKWIKKLVLAMGN